MGPAVARWLRDHSHEVFSVYEKARGTVDDDIHDMAYSEHWILITNHKDFGDRVYRDKRPLCEALRLKSDRVGVQLVLAWHKIKFRRSMSGELRTC